MEQLKISSDVLFILLGAVLVLAMHAGFAFLEVGTVRRKNQVNALVKILCRFRHFYRSPTFSSATRWRTAPDFSSVRRSLTQQSGYAPHQVLLPVDLRGCGSGHRFGRHRRARALSPAACRQCRPRRLRVSVLRGHRLERQPRRSGLAERAASASPFHDFAGSVVVHAMGGWIALWPSCCSAPGADATGRTAGWPAHPPSSIPFLALGAWVLTVGWFGFNVMSAQTHRQDQRLGRGEFADGHGGRHARGAVRWSKRPGLHA